MDDLNIFIGGNWRRGGGNLMQSHFPADGAVNATLHAASLEDLQELSTPESARGAILPGVTACRMRVRRSCIRWRI